MTQNWFESLGPWTGEGEFDLTRMRLICAELDNFQDKVPSVHIAGTNGKGSTAATVAAIMGHAGLSVGVNISPHLESYHERFLIDGLPIDSDSFSRAVSPVEAAAAKTGEMPSFHEGATLVAFSAFQNLDRAVYEAGLGGRLDASNVLRAPLVSVITSIGFDHQAILGTTLEKIAFEKAGIIKEGVPVVVGNMPEVALQEIERIAALRGSRLFYYGRDFSVETDANVFRYKSDSLDFSFHSSLKGKHQLSNMGCALTAARLSGIDIRQHSAGLESLYWPGRLDDIEYRHKHVLIDCAHNQQGLEGLIDELNYRDLKKAVFIFGMLRRPDWKEIVARLTKLPFSFALVTAPGDRALSSRELKEEWEANGVKSVIEFDYDYSGVLQYATESEAEDIIIAGSIYLVGALRPLLGCKLKPVWKRGKS